MKRANEERLRVDELDDDMDASDLDPNEQAVLSQQTAPNRTPAEDVQAPNPPSGQGATEAPSEPLHDGARRDTPLRKTSDPAGGSS